MAISGEITRWQNSRMRFGELYVGGVPVSGLSGAMGGSDFFVSDVSGDGGLAGNEGKTLTAPALTLAAVLDSGDLAAGDRIHLLPGHTEEVIAAAGLDIDTAGITIYFHGSGASRASITFSTDVAADMDIDAASVTLVNPLFIAGVDALTGPIDVNAADFTIINGEWRDAPAMGTTDCIVADAAADRMRILGWTYIDSTTGTQKQSNIQVAAADDILLQDIWIVGDFGTGVIENGTAWINATLNNVIIDNKSASPTVGILLQATSSGTMNNVKIRVASGVTYLTVNNDMQFFNSEGTGTDASSGETIGTTLGTDVESVVGELADAAATGAVTSTDTLVAYIKQLVTMMGTELDTNTLGAILYGTGGIATFPTAAAAANAVSIAEVLRYISEYQVPRVVSKNIAAAGSSLTTGASPVSLFTVTGNVKARVYAVVTTALASTLNNGTLAIGVSGNTGGFIAATTADGTNFATNTVWAGDTSPTLLAEVMSNGALNFVLIGNGADIVCTVATNSMTAGQITFYCEYIPLDSSSTVVAA